MLFPLLGVSYGSAHLAGGSLFEPNNTSGCAPPERIRFLLLARIPAARFSPKSATPFRSTDDPRPAGPRPAPACPRASPTAPTQRACGDHEPTVAIAVLAAEGRCSPLRHWGMARSSRSAIGPLCQKVTLPVDCLHLHRVRSDRPRRGAKAPPAALPTPAARAQTE